MKLSRNALMQAPFEFSNQLNKQITNIYNVIISSTQTQKMWHINQSRWLTDSLSCTISMTVNLSQLTLEADPNKIPHKIWFNMSKKHQIKDFPQNSRRWNRVVIMNMGNSIPFDLYRFLIQYKPVHKSQGFTKYWPEISQLISSKTVCV